MQTESLNQTFESVQKPVHVDTLTYAGSAFGSTPEGEQVFINARIVEGMKLSEGHIVIGHLLPNYPDKREYIPWRAMRVTRTEEQAAPVKQPEPEPEVEEQTPGDKILAVIKEAPEGYFTTVDLMEETGLDTKTVNNWAMGLHNRGLIARADVHASPNQKRASFILWALNSKSFA